MLPFEKEGHFALHMSVFTCMSVRLSHLVQLITQGRFGAKASNLELGI